MASTSRTKQPTDARGDRLGRDDWIKVALTALAGGGLGALSIERLAKELGATKGSFYWHFKDRSALLEAALAQWEVRDTDRVIEQASTIDDPRERLRQVFALVFDDSTNVQIDATLLADADNPIVAAALQRVAAKRLGFIQQQFKAMGTKNGSDRAFLTFTAFVGLTQLRRTAPDLTPHGRRSAAYVKNISEWLVP